jgi:hypothetical protein
MQAHAGAQMTAYGYALDPTRFSFSERLTYAFVDRPVNRIRMLTWLVRETIQHHYPAQFGRKPSSNMVFKDHTNHE